VSAVRQAAVLSAETAGDRMPLDPVQAEAGHRQETLRLDTASDVDPLEPTSVDALLSHRELLAKVLSDL
jgi:hypothetical protein